MARREEDGSSTVVPAGTTWQDWIIKKQPREVLKELFGKIKAELLNRRRVVVEADRVFRGRRRLVDRSLVRWSFYESDTELLVVVDEELRGVLTFYKNTKIAEGRYGRMREIEL